VYKQLIEGWNQGSAEAFAAPFVERRPIADLTVEQVALLAQERQNEQAAITVNTLIANKGYHYQAGAVLPEPGAGLPLMQDPSEWHGESGTRAPHIMIERDGKRISSLDLFGRRLVLLVGPDAQAGERWQASARQVADRLTMPLDIQRMGSEIADVDGSIGAAYNVGATGAVLPGWLRGLAGAGGGSGPGARYRARPQAAARALNYR
jgi:hypothetical protein